MDGVVSSMLYNLMKKEKRKEKTGSSWTDGQREAKMRHLGVVEVSSRTNGAWAFQPSGGHALPPCRKYVPNPGLVRLENGIH